MHLHDSVQQYARTRDEQKRVHLKAKKIAQLTTKLYHLSVLEDTLNVRLNLQKGQLNDKAAIMKTSSLSRHDAPPANSSYF